jgi:hypothetical protein
MSWTARFGLQPAYRGFAMRTRNLWLIALLVGALSIALEIWLVGWEDIRHRWNNLVFLALIFSPILIPTVLVGLPLCGMLGLWVAERKLREPIEGFFLGLLLGPLGVLIEAALPDQGLRARDERLRR